MSQASFLESVVTWDEKLCQQNLQEALPKLVNHLQEAVVLQEEIGILKIICVSFLPWVQIEEAEELVFADISSKGCLMLDKVLEEIKSLPKHSAACGDFQALLEVLVELLDCFTQCIKCAQGAGNSHELATIHSLPYGAIYLLKGTYTHCKDSSEVYGDALASVTEPLSVLFKKAHALQLALLGLLDNIVINSNVSQQDIDDLCYVCRGLFELCQIVSSLDVKLVVSLWKAVSRLSGRHKNQLKDGLDVDTMVTYLCTEINKGYMYLLQLAPCNKDQQELSLSQGDSAAFQKSLKVLGYQLRVIISLLDSFIDTVSDCVKSAYGMIIAIFRSLPPSITVVNISVTSLDEIRRHLVNGIEPLVNLLVQNRTFVTFILAQESECNPEDRLARLELLLKIGDCLPKQTDDVLQSWMRNVKDDATSSIFEQIFSAASQCYIEMCMPLTIRTTKEVVLYEYICTHVCGLVGSLPAKYFGTLEECLLKHLFSVNLYVSSLAEDVWCFMARFGSAELCHQHTKLLVDVCEVAGYPYSIVKIVRRLTKFLAPDHQNQLLKCYHPDNDHIRLWCDVFVPVLPSAVSTDNWTSLFRLTLEDIQNFISTRNKTYADLVQLIQSLKYLIQLLHHHGNTPVDLQSQHSAVVKETVAQLFALWDREWTGEAIFGVCLSQLTELSGLLMSQLENEDFVKIFDLLLNYVKMEYDSVKVSTCNFLKRCKKVKFAQDSKQPMILKKIPMLYSLLLQDKNGLVHHTALESFTQFAESTPYETLVPECLGDNQQLQNTVVAFLSKTVTTEMGPDFDELTYLQQQKEKLCQQQQYDSSSNQMVDGQQYSTVVGEKRGNIEETASGDMLDDIEEPALKRKRCQDIKEQDDDLQTVICDLEQNFNKLEQMCQSRTLSTVYKNRLKSNRLLKCYPPDNDHVRLWCDIFVPVLPSAVSTDNWTLLFRLTLEDIQNFISTRNKTYADLVQLIQSLKYLTQLLHHHSNTPVDLQSQHSAVVKETIAQLFALWDREWTGEAIFGVCLSQLTELSGLLISQLDNEDFLKIFDLLLNHVKMECDSVKISTCNFLKRCKKVKFAPDSKQPMILKKIPMLYSLLLQDNNGLVHHTALESFTQFAESTPYETLVPECLGDNQQLQNTVVAFLSKTVTTEVGPDFDELTYLKQQNEKLCQQQQYDSSSNRQVERQQYSTIVGDKRGEIEETASGDMLDDIEEPALKRKRCQDIKEKDDDIQTVICELEQNFSKLEQVCKSKTLSTVYKNRLKTVGSKLLCLIDKT